MRKLYLTLIQEPVRNSVIYWGIAFSIAYLNFQYNFGIDVVLLSLFTFFCILIGSFSMMSIRKVPLFLRRVSPSVNRFWFDYICVNFLFLSFNMIFVAVMQISFSKNVGVTFDFNYLDCLWWGALSLSGPFLLIGAADANLQKNILNKPHLIIASFIVVYASAFAIVLLFIWSRVLSYLFAFSVCWIIVIGFNPLIKTSIHQAKRIRIGIFGLVCAIGFAILSYAVERLIKAPGDSAYLGHLYPKPKVKIEIDQMQSADDWIVWYSNQASSDDLLRAFPVLDKVCPFINSDFPGEALCETKNTNGIINLDLERYSQHEIIKLLKAESSYSKWAAIVGLRKFGKEISEEARLELTRLSREPGSAISFLAANTLHGDSKSLRSVKVRFRKKAEHEN